MRILAAEPPGAENPPTFPPAARTLWQGMISATGFFAMAWPTLVKGPSPGRTRRAGTGHYFCRQTVRSTSERHSSSYQIEPVCNETARGSWFGHSAIDGEVSRGHRRLGGRELVPQFSKQI